MKDSTPQTIYLKDYAQPNYWVDKIHLTFDLDENKTRVISVMNVRANGDNKAPLELVGEHIELGSVSINGEELNSDQYKVTEEQLIISDIPSEFELKIVNTLNPSTNKTLEGLYKSGGMYCTQNEPEGFRRITYYVDRPDNMAVFTTKIIADKKSYPVLLSNGNPIGEGELADGKHWMEWHDPFPKPSYLYALVAGDLGLVQDKYTTKSGREIDLRIYCDKGNEDKCDHAMESLKKSMKWDEDRFRLEYDLDIYMIVAADSFNMGAMENKGLNIFNSHYVLARQDTATDDNFLGIEAVVGHEYFHNWTGNRVTCRDWFQLTLKEGLTVFRDQEFSADLNSRGVKRIEDVKILRMHQFVEDAGPTAHPIKPESYIEINNFYTVTVYEKGAEVIRMLHTFLGEEKFQAGMDKYFELYDGQAVTTEDFLHAMSVAGNFDTTQFVRWYQQAGTPTLKVEHKQNLDEGLFTLKITQDCPPTPKQVEKLPFHMPFAVALLDDNGEEQSLKLVGRDDQPDIARGILHLKEKVEEFVFENVTVDVLPSLNRNFSAPINLETSFGKADFAKMMAIETDDFNRYEAGTSLAKMVFKDLLSAYQGNAELVMPQDYIDAFKSVITNKDLDTSVASYLLTLPPESDLLQSQAPMDIHGTHAVREFMKKALAKACETELLSRYENLDMQNKYDLSPSEVGRRNLKDTVLSYLVLLGHSDLAVKQLQKCDNMTESISALSALVNNNAEEANTALSEFYNKWKTDMLVLNKWFAVQSGVASKDTLARVRELQKVPEYDETVPNIVRAVIGFFTKGLTSFHREDGKGYEFLADEIIKLDKINPSIASGLAMAFKYNNKLPENLKTHSERELNRIMKSDLSKNTYEIVSKILGK